MSHKKPVDRLTMFIDIQTSTKNLIQTCNNVDTDPLFCLQNISIAQRNVAALHKINTDHIMAMCYGNIFMCLSCHVSVE